jgi:hypothetical protein
MCVVVVAVVSQIEKLIMSRESQFHGIFQVVHEVISWQFVAFILLRRTIYVFYR